MTQDLVKHESPQTPNMPAYFPSDSDWKLMMDFGMRAVKSGLLPQGIKTPEAAAIIALKGRELGISFMTAIANVYVINGKPTMSAELIQALARKNLPGLVINILESTNEIAKIEFIRPEKGSKAFTMSFSIEDAKRADLLKNPTWQKYPSAMLWSRCVTAGLRKVCPEALMGVSYTPEEMGANVDGEGNVIETTHRKIEEPVKPVQKPVEPYRITREQLMNAVQNHNVPLDEVKKFLKETFHVESSKDLNQDQIDHTMEWIITGPHHAPKDAPAAPWEKELGGVSPHEIK